MAEITLEELRGKRQQETLAAQKAPETAVKEMEKQELTPEEREAGGTDQGADRCDGTLRC